MEDVTGALGGADPPVPSRLQVLLSRAVEEQVSEQRALNSVLADLRTQVSALPQAAGGLASTAAVEHLESTVGALVSDVRTAATLLGQRIDDLSGRIDQLVVAGFGAPPAPGDLPEVAALRADIAGLRDALAILPGLRGHLDDLAALTTASYDGLRPQLFALGVQLEHIRVGTDPELLRASLDATVTTRLARLSERVEVLAARVRPTDELVVAVADRLAGALGPQVAELVLSGVGDALADALLRRRTAGEATGAAPPVSPVAPTPAHVASAPAPGPAAVREAPEPPPAPVLSTHAAVPDGSVPARRKPWWRPGG